MLSEKSNAFLRPLKNKGFKEERVTTMSLNDLRQSTTLESNKSLRGTFALPLLPISLHIPEEASRVPQEGLQQHALGGVLLAAPSALCGSPVLTQGRSG